MTKKHEKFNPGGKDTNVTEQVRPNLACSATETNNDCSKQILYYLF